MLLRLAGAALATAVVTLLAVEPKVGWLPNVAAGALPGLASVGLVTTGATLGGLLSNSIGPSLLQRYNLRLVFVGSAVLQGILLGAIILALGTTGFADLGILALGALLFVNAVGSPAMSGLSRYWWEAVDLPVGMAKRGASLESTFAAIAWSVGPVLAAPLVLWTPWMVAVFWALGILGLLLLMRMPQPPVKEKAVRATKPARLHGWWLPGTYAFYHIARGLLNSGLTATLLVGDQRGLIGAATASPSLGHTVGGVLFAARKDPERQLQRDAILGLVGQGIPTLLLALVFWLAPQLSAFTLATAVIGGGALAGVLKAPVAAVIYPLARQYSPHLTVIESTAMISNGMIVGGLLGPLLASLIIVTVGPGWLLTCSAAALGCCLCGFILHPSSRAQRG